MRWGHLFVNHFNASMATVLLVFLFFKASHCPPGATISSSKLMRLTQPTDLDTPTVVSVQISPSSPNVLRIRCLLSIMAHVRTESGFFLTNVTPALLRSSSAATV
ncbi:hypothetical protein BDF19DRAFT_454911 [Syncephalis fuscata]|nr:hypothetical protein BDF19DRAFT_454911 [Syncephalis fuscata]